MVYLAGSPDTSGQEEQLRLQREQIEAQEARDSKKKADEAQRMQASLRARQRGGSRALMYSGRFKDDESTLGGGTSVWTRKTRLPR